jgi:hypothetical protein
MPIRATLLVARTVSEYVVAAVTRTLIVDACADGDAVVATTKASLDFAVTRPNAKPPPLGAPEGTAPLANPEGSPLAGRPDGGAPDGKRPEGRPDGNERGADDPPNARHLPRFAAETRTVRAVRVVVDADASRAAVTRAQEPTLTADRAADFCTVNTVLAV